MEIENLDECDNGKGIITLAKMRCMEEENKYWLEEKGRKYVFCEKEGGIISVILLENAI